MGTVLYQRLVETVHNHNMPIEVKVEGLRQFGLWLTGYIHSNLSDADFDKLVEIFQKLDKSR
jgi:hypothetical protein